MSSSPSTLLSFVLLESYLLIFNSYRNELRAQLREKGQEATIFPLCAHHSLHSNESNKNNWMFCVFVLSIGSYPISRSAVNDVNKTIVKRTHNDFFTIAENIYKKTRTPLAAKCWKIVAEL